MLRRLWVIGVALISVLMPLFLADYVVILFKNNESWLEMVGLILLLYLGVIARILWHFIIKVFDMRLASLTRIKYIVAAYLYIIGAFAGIYFLLYFVFDYREAQAKYNYYNSVALYASPAEREYLLENNVRFKNSSAFNGITAKLWVSVDSWDLPTNRKMIYTKYTSELVPLSSVLASATLPQYETIWYLGKNKWNVYTDCWYLSAITVATVGYGDIAPNNLYAKLLVGFEVLIGQMVMVLGLGTLFAKMTKD